MRLTLSPYVGDGTRKNKFRPKIDGASIDLRPDCTVRDGYALVNTEEPVKLTLGEDFRDTFGPRVRNRVHNLLGVDVSRVKRFDVLAATLMLDPNGWNPVRPTRTRYEIWLGGLAWEFPLVQGGVTDNFNRANENPIQAPWTTYGFTALAINTNACVASAVASDCGGIYTGAASTADQYAEMNNWETDGTGLGGPIVRASTNQNHYLHEIGNNFSAAETARSKFVSTTFTAFASSGTNIPAAGNIPIRIEVEGTSIRTYVNGVETANSPITDSSLASGQVGLFNYRTTRSISDWEGGDLAPPPSAGAPIAWIRA